MNSGLVEYEQQELRDIVKRIHESPLEALSVLVVAQRGVTTWYRFETFLSAFGFPESQISVAAESLAKDGILRIIDHGRITSPNAVVIITELGKTVYENLKDRERDFGPAVLRFLLFSAIEQRMAKSNPEMSRLNLLPVLEPIVDSWIERARQHREGTIQ